MKILEGKTSFFSETSDLIFHWEEHLVTGRDKVINREDELTADLPEDTRQWIIDSYDMEIRAMQAEGSGEMSLEAIQVRIISFENEKNDIISCARQALIAVR